MGRGVKKVDITPVTDSKHSRSHSFADKELVFVLKMPNWAPVPFFSVRL